MVGVVIKERESEYVQDVGRGGGEIVCFCDWNPFKNCFKIPFSSLDHLTREDSLGNTDLNGSSVTIKNHKKSIKVAQKWFH